MELGFEEQRTANLDVCILMIIYLSGLSTLSHLLFWVLIVLSSGCTRKTRVIDTVYNATNNELVRTKTLVKGAIIAVDAVPFRQWYESHYATALGRKKGVKLSEEDEAKFDKEKMSKTQKKNIAKREKYAPVEPNLVEQFTAGRLLARISSRPGQSGRADGYILEGKELEFYLRKIRAKKAK